MDEEILSGIPKVNPNTFNSYASNFFTTYVAGLTPAEIQAIFSALLSNSLSSLWYHRNNGYHTIIHSGSLAPSSGVGQTANKVIALPFYNSRPCIASKLAFNVTNVSGGGSIRVGIYDDTGLCYPNNLLVDAGALSCATDGLKESGAFSVQFKANSLYWLVYVAESTPTLSAVNGDWINSFSNAPNVQEANYYTYAGVYGALGTPFQVGLTPAYFVALARIAVYLTH